MTPQIPRVGSTVLYTLTEQDASAINKRRKDAQNLNAAGVTLASQELGAQIHVGNAVKAGDVYPLAITRTWGDQPESAVNGQLLLDGNDTYWVTSVSAGEGERHFTYLQETCVGEVVELEAMVDTLHVGATVHYVSYGTPGGEFKSACRAATVTEVDEHDPNRVGLSVQNPTGLFFHSLADGGSDHYVPPQGVKGYHGGSWHWPERV